MQKIELEKAIKGENSSDCKTLEYSFSDNDIDLGIATITGRYPEKGYCYNEISKELVYVLEGTGEIVFENTEITFKKGDAILINPNEKYYWDSNYCVVSMSCTPAWQESQHKESNMSSHKHAIMIIRNSEGKYLNYYDDRWNSYLFLNNKTKEDNDLNTQKKFIMETLNLEEMDLELKLIHEKIHTKYSESAKKDKEYHHYFYNVEIKSLKPFLMKEEFELNDKKYKWFSLKELEEDPRIQKVNSDIVTIIKELGGD